MRRPAGALQRHELHAGRLYFVYATDSYGHQRTGRIEIDYFDHAPNPVENWLNGIIGHVFDNYFHALAYSLKVKQHGKKDSPVSGA